MQIFNNSWWECCRVRKRLYKNNKQTKSNEEKREYVCLLEWCCKRIDDLAQLGRDPGQGHLLEGGVGVPLLADGGTQTVLVLGPAREGVWDLVHRIRCCLLVALLVDDHMGQLGILALADLDTVAGLCLLHNDVLLLLGALSTPGTLKYVKSDDNERKE